MLIYFIYSLNHIHFCSLNGWRFWLKWCLARGVNLLHFCCVSSSIVANGKTRGVIFGIIPGKWIQHVTKTCQFLHRRAILHGNTADLIKIPNSLDSPGRLILVFSLCVLYQLNFLMQKNFNITYLTEFTPSYFCRWATLNFTPILVLAIV